MKKIIVTMMFILMLIATTVASAEIMNGEVYDFIMVNKEFRVFESLENGEEKIIDGTAYSWSTGYYLMEEYQKLTNKELEKLMEEQLNEIGIVHVAVHFYEAGKNVLWVQINSFQKLNPVFEMNEEETPVYSVNLLAWREQP